MKTGTKKTKQNKKKNRNMTSNLYMYKLLLVDIIETKYFSKGRPPLGYTQWKTDLIYFSKIVVLIRHGSPGGVLWEFLGGMCRWDPGTLSLYQS